MPMNFAKHRLFLFIFAFAAPAAAEVEGITLSDPALQVEMLDTHPEEFFLSHDMDLSGRLIMGAREAVFVMSAQLTERSICV